MTFNQPLAMQLRHAGFIFTAFTVSAVAAAGADDEYGSESSGIRCRIAAVDPDTDDESPSLENVTRQFVRGDDVTFAVDLKNVSDHPITLLGVRYGDSYPTAKGKLNTALLGPLLFDFQFTNDEGDPIPRAQRAFQRHMIMLSGASAHKLPPGKSLTVLLRPSQFRKPADYLLPAGDYRVKVRYRGPSAEMLGTMESLQDMPQGNAWSHEVVSNSVRFSIADDAAGVHSADLVWGPETKGLQAAIELQVPGYILESPSQAPGIPLRSKTGIVFHVKNVSDQPITFYSESSRQEDRALVFDSQGNQVNARSTFFSGWPIQVHWRLKPGDVAKLSVLAPAINQISKPGEYRLAYDINIGSITMQDKDGNQILPEKNDWKGKLRTGEIPLFLRLRTAEDDDRAKPPHFVGKLRFVDDDGQNVKSGSFTFRGQIKNKYHKDRLIKPGPITIPDCTTNGATITVRADGFEEAVFYDVKFKADQTTTLTLKKASPVELKVVDARDGSPIAGALIRYFNRTSAKASSGPYPTSGLAGPIWATTGDDGKAALTSLQKINPYYEKLGDALYYFYIEPPTDELAPTFIGPVRAGQDFGEIKLGPYVEVHGEVHGSAEELERFAAEWDQPFVQQTDNPDGTFLYAKSARLKTVLDGDQRSFRLTNLRPGLLRIISNFGPRPHKTKHVYSRREVGETDVLVAVELEKPVTKVVITPQGLQEAKEASE